VFGRTSNPDASAARALIRGEERFQPRALTSFAKRLRDSNLGRRSGGRTFLLLVFDDEQESGLA
jgi:hypothetical protein